MRMIFISLCWFVCAHRSCNSMCKYIWCLYLKIEAFIPLSHKNKRTHNATTQSNAKTINICSLNQITASAKEKEEKRTNEKDKTKLNI